VWTNGFWSCFISLLAFAAVRELAGLPGLFFIAHSPLGTLLFLATTADGFWYYSLIPLVFGYLTGYLAHAKPGPGGPSGDQRSLLPALAIILGGVIAAFCGASWLLPATVTLVWLGIFLGCQPWKHSSDSDGMTLRAELGLASDTHPLSPVPPMRPRDWRAAVAVSNVFSLVLGFLSAGVAAWLDQDAQGTGGSAGTLASLGQWTENLLVAVNFLIIPFGVGFLASYFWRDIPEKSWHFRGCGFQFVNFLFALLGASLILGDNAPTLWMTAPMAGFVMAAGVGTGRGFWKKTSFLGSYVLPALVMLILLRAFWPQWSLISVLAGGECRPEVMA